MRVANLGSDPGALVRNLSTKINRYGSRTSLSTSISNNIVRIRREAGSVVDETQLTTIPQWDGAESTRAEVKLPQYEGDTVTIVLNKEFQARYPLFGPENEPLPAVIERDTRFIQKPEVLLRLTEDRKGPAERPTGSNLPRKRYLTQRDRSLPSSPPTRDSNTDGIQNETLLEVLPDTDAEDHHRPHKMVKS
jgi:hypothetical protein